MPKRSNEFQKLVELIYKTYKNKDDIKIQESCLIKDSDGVQREIDILIEKEFIGKTFNVAVECRDHKRKADVLWLDQIKGKYDKLPIDKIIAVSKKGFTKTALGKANNMNIETISLEDADVREWENKLQLFFINFIKTDISLKNATLQFKPKISSLIAFEEPVYGKEKKYLGKLNELLLNYFHNEVVPEISKFLYNEYFPSCKNEEDLKRLIVLDVDAKISNHFVKGNNDDWYTIDEVKYNIQINTILTRSKTNYYKYDENILISESLHNDSNKTFKVNVIQNSKSGLKYSISIVKNV